MNDTDRNNLGEIIRQQRITVSLTLQQLAGMSDVSASHLGRIERGERFPSASILRKVTQPLGFEEDELFTLAGYLSPHSPSIAKAGQSYSSRQLAPYVARVLAEESVKVQRAVVGILSILKSIAKTMTQESR